MNPISDIRAQLQVTQAALAAGLGVSQATISNYERGHNMPIEVAKRLIVFAAEQGVALTYNDIYEPVQLVQRAHRADDTVFGRRKDDPPPPPAPAPHRRKDDLTAGVA
jgi:transcriptional regulator with XRE-family HTH domain